MLHMKSQARALFSLRITWIYMAIIAASMTAIPMLLTIGESRDEPFSFSSFFESGQIVLIVVLFGAAMIPGSDLVKGATAWCYLSHKNRFALMTAQLVVLLGAFLVAASLGVAVGILGVCALGFRVDFVLSKQDWASIASVYSQWIVLGTIALLLTYILGRAVYAALLMVLDALFLEVSLPLLGKDWAETLAQFLPLRNSIVVVQGVDAAGMGTDIGQAAAAAILVVTIGALGLLAWRTVNRCAVN
ncbi:hypothetical protein H7347_01930 [Corynebacterium sp. zg-331]|uniref:hypothetical protein n=1 Tax=unclassified Corynebacterium TaxID=2624378 RepID=UPI00128C3055|nr:MULTISPECIES: hypothetical protein [unclassified Corynebacterium]MBC3185346.1 hypothetical protein [Corynebacterium sp. zg-331]MPV51843.1 hypothetical protein [Corynebacterium sp. zg331]